jgi:mannose-6-phosphate isomerase class I
VASDKFVLDRWRLDSSERWANDDRFHILSVVDGEVSIVVDDADYSMSRGDTRLLPANCRDIEFHPQGRAGLLDIYLP